MKYRKKPIVIEAMQWDGTTEGFEKIHNWICLNLKDPFKSPVTMCCDVDPTRCRLEVGTLEGIMSAIPSDYIIKGISDEIYPCKQDIFEKSYEKVEE